MTATVAEVYTPSTVLSAALAELLEEPQVLTEARAAGSFPWEVVR